MEAVKKTSPYWLIEGEWPAGSGEILVGENVAENLNLKIGSTVTLSFTPEADEGAGASENAGADDEVVLDNMIDFVVKGTLNTGGSEEDYVYIPMADLEELTGIAEEIDLAEVSISTSGDGLNAYMERINTQVPAVHARLVKRVTASETTVLSKLQALVLLVTVVVLALTMICVATTMTAVVTERRREIGLRKAIGASDASIIQEFMGEGMLLGGVGGILGSGLGFAFAQFVSVNVFSSTITLRPVLVPVTIIVSIVITGVACLLPIKSATKVDPALVLKGE